MSTVSDILIQPHELARLLAAPRPPTLLDVRWPEAGDAAAGRRDRLPGAVVVDMDDAFSGPAGRAGRHPLPATAAFTAAMRRCGVSGGRPVVVYDDGATRAAARAWWCLSYFGHPDVRLLDGGYRAWQAAGLPTTADPPAMAPADPPGVPRAERPAGDFVATPGHRPMLTADQAAALARDGLLLDVRGPERYRGEDEPIDPVAGHIPGAVNLPTTGNRDRSGRFRAPAELRERFAAAGADGTRPVGVYCGSGIAAAQEVLALELAGIHSALYVGSWSEWIGDASRPVATGGTAG